MYLVLCNTVLNVQLLTPALSATQHSFQVPIIPHVSAQILMFQSTEFVFALPTIHNIRVPAINALFLIVQIATTLTLVLLATTTLSYKSHLPMAAHPVYALKHSFLPPQTTHAFVLP